ncbi:MAG: beta-N-acetylhexosaminidase [Notoacmeibacter sp.]
MPSPSAAIFGLLGHSLSVEEIGFFKRVDPWGYILFARNIDNAAQLRALTASIRAVSGRKNVPIFIDQEGGRVQRIKAPLAPLYPTGRQIGEIYKMNRKKGLRAAWLMSRLHAFDLEAYGINADCLPVLDVPIEGAHDVIGNRAYSHDPNEVAEIGMAAAEGLVAGGVLPVIKHIPGHGRGASDSHLDLPVVTTPHEELSATDFVPFKALSKMPIAMTAHITYSALDDQAPATLSKTVIRKIIRKEIGFDGLLMSDDVSMKALSGDFASRTGAIFAAGCDMVLHCNGDMAEMVAIAALLAPLRGKSLKRAKRAVKWLGKGKEANESALRDEFAAIFS